ncbi:MAG TPA: hypothetical protein ENJ33_08405, partial [Thiothrix sp.]|nr:hypothetical protein [Thiothrix sp.]
KKRVVSESTLNTCIKTARKAIGDNGRAQKYIATIYRRGYRFIADVEENACHDSHAEKTTQNPTKINHATHTSIAMETRPSISISPLSHNLKTEYAVWLAEIFTEEINRHLANIPSYIVIAHRTTPTSPADYVLTGSIRKINSHFKLSLQLLETATGQFLWANHQALAIEHNETKAAKLEVVVHTFIAQIEPELNRAELNRLNQQPIEELDAWSLYRKANATLAQKGWNDESFNSVSRLLNEATRQDPTLALITAHLSAFLSISQLIGLNHDHEWKKQAVQAAEKAIDLDSQDSHILGDVGCTFAITGDYERGKHLIQHALELNADNADAWAALGAIKLNAHDESGVDNLRQGIAMSPRDNRTAAWGALLSRGLLSLERLDEAIEVADKTCQCDDKILLPRVVSTLAHHAMGSTDKALLAWQDVLRINPAINQQTLGQLTNKKQMRQLQSLNIYPQAD